jgi:hypothetical protein
MRREEAHKAPPPYKYIPLDVWPRVCFNGSLEEKQEKLSAETKGYNILCSTYVSGIRFSTKAVHHAEGAWFKL